MKKILFIEGVYDTMDLFSQALKKAYQDMGYEAISLHAQEEANYKNELKKLDPKDIVALITFNNLAYRIELEEDQNYWEQHQIPYIDILMDHPFHYKNQLEHLPNTAIVLCTDKNHVPFLKKYEPNLNKVDFLPHAGILQQMSEKRIEDRDILVLYAGSLPFQNASLMIPDLSEEIRFDAIDMSKRVLDALITDSSQTTEEAICGYLKERALIFSDKEIYDIIYKMRFLDSYATSFFREQAIRVLVESGIDVTVYGSGWEVCEWKDNPHFHWMGKVSAHEVLHLMQHAKIVLSTQTWYKNGAHDRIFNGMLAKACVITDTSKFLQEEFLEETKKNSKLVFFQRENLKELPDIVKDLLNHPNKMQKIADGGYAFAKEKHSWNVRAEQILTILKKFT